jgi:hypothetical protein
MTSVKDFIALTVVLTRAKIRNWQLPRKSTSSVCAPEAAEGAFLTGEEPQTKRSPIGRIPICLDQVSSMYASGP